MCGTEETLTECEKPKRRRVLLTENEVDDVCKALQLLLEITNRMFEQQLSVQLESLGDDGGDSQALQELLLIRQKLFLFFLNKSSDLFKGSLKDKEYTEMGFDPSYFDNNYFLLDQKDINQIGLENKIDNVIKIEDYIKNKKKKK